MKRFWIVWWISCMYVAWIALVGEASAQTTPAAIRVKIDKNFDAHVEGPSDCRVGSSDASPKLKMPFSVPSSGGTSEFDLILMLTETVECKTGDVWTATDVGVALDGDTSYPFPILPREYQWSYGAGSWVDLAITRLGTPSSCEAASGSTAPQPGSKPGSCNPIRNPAGIAFELPTAIDRGVIAARYPQRKGNIGTGGNNPDITVTIPVYPCEFDVTGPLPGMVAGASRQVLTLTQAQKAWNCRLPKKAATLHQTGLSRPIPVELEDVRGGGQMLTLSDIPQDTPTGPQSFELRMAGGLLAVVRTSVIPPVTASKLVVDYHVPRDLDLYNHFGAAGGDSDEPVAVVSPTRFGEKAAVTNTAVFSWSSVLPSTSQDPTDFNTRLQAIVDGKSTDDYSELSYLSWKARPEDGSGAVLIDGCSPAPCTLKTDLRRVTFVVTRPIPDKVNVMLELERTFKRPHEKEARTQSVLQVTLPLAQKARVESIPLPARDLVEVRCRGEDVGFWNGEVHAVSENAVEEGQCRAKLTLDQLLVKRADKSQEFYKLLPLYGPQSFSVTVRRGGVESKQLWQFSLAGDGAGDGTPACGPAAPGKPEKKDCPSPSQFAAASIGLKAPKSDKKTDAYYTVEIYPTAVQNLEVKYRKSIVTKLDVEAGVASAGELTYEARLRSRGLFGVNCEDERDPDRIYDQDTCLRMYLTTSVIASGLRFPAARSELKSSTSSADVQYLTPLVGALFTFEPWDYDNGNNAWAPLNPVLQLGGHFYDTGRGAVGFNPLIGIAATLPLLQEETPAGSQLGTKATLGLFFEYDTRDASPHALFALSVNIGSLLSGR